MDCESINTSLQEGHEVSSVLIIDWGDREPRPIPVFQLLPGDSFFLPGDSL